MINIVLVEPEIPSNTGNIVRTCVATGSKLHLVKPLGFDISDKALKRAGLDYWSEADIKVYENLDKFFKENDGEFYFASTKSQKAHTDVQYTDGCYIFFGPETRGLNEKLLFENYEKCIRIPMVNDTRSLNLANSVAIIVYEAYRQLNYKGFNLKGHLRNYK